MNGTIEVRRDSHRRDKTGGGVQYLFIAETDSFTERDGKVIQVALYCTCLLLPHSIHSTTIVGDSVQMINSHHAHVVFFPPTPCERGD